MKGRERRRAGWAVRKPRFTYRERGSGQQRIERGGPVEACSRSRGRRDAGKSLGRGLPFERPDPGVAFPSPRSLLWTHAPLPQENG